MANPTRRFEWFFSPFAERVFNAMMCRVRIWICAVSMMNRCSIGVFVKLVIIHELMKGEGCLTFGKNVIFQESKIGY